MRRILLILSLCLSAPAAGFAQTTAVSGTVTDLSGLPYAGGQLKAQLVLNGAGVTGQPVVTINNNAQCAAAGQGSAPCKVPFQGTQGPLQLDPTGSFNIVLQDNTQVTPSGTQWLFTMTTTGTPPPLGTGPQVCTATLTISGASQPVTSSFNACPALSQGNLNSLSTTGVTLSPQCGKATTPCIAIPPSGGCFGGVNGAITSATTPTITFASGFPSNPTPQVGQLAWVISEHGGSPAVPANLCSTAETFASGFTEPNYCGKSLTSGGTPYTITAVNPGVSITVSQNCQSTQNGTNAVFFYAPNIFSQMQTACLGPNGNGSPQQSVHVAAGVYAVDNTGNGTQSPCGCVQLSGCLPNTYAFAHLTGEGVYTTEIYTPPWYNHTGDLGTVLAGGTLDNIMFGGGWTNIATSVNRGTVFDGNACGSHDFALVGFNLSGSFGTSESMYPSATLLPGTGSCEIRNAYILSGDSGIDLGNLNPSGIGGITNSVVYTQNPAFISPANGTTSIQFKIFGGHYATAGRNRSGGNAGVIAAPADASSATGDRFVIEGADLCVVAGTNVPAINDTETTGSVTLTNVQINTSPLCSPGANVGGITTASGITVKSTQTTVAATGTGVPITMASGSTYVDDCGNVTSGGAANSFAANTYQSSGCVLNDATPTISSGFGTSPSVVSGTGVSAGNFRVNVGGGGAATSGVVGLPTAPTGWNCPGITDITTNVVTRQTANTANTVTLTAAAAWGANDILELSCKPF